MPLRGEGLIEWLGPASLPSETGINNRPGAHANGRGLPTDDIRHRVTGIRCCGNENRFSTLTISAVGDREIRGGENRDQAGGGNPRMNWFT